MPNLTAADFPRLMALDIPDNVTALAFSPDGSLLAVAAGDKVHLYSVPPQARKQENTEPGNAKTG